MQEFGEGLGLARGGLYMGHVFFGGEPSGDGRSPFEMDHLGDEFGASKCCQICRKMTLILRHK